MCKKAEYIISNYQEIQNVSWVIGESAPAFYYNMLADQDGETSFAEGLITTRSPKATEAILPRLQREFDRALPQARTIVRGLVQGPPISAPVEVRVIGQNLDVLKTIGEKIREIMVSVPEIVQARTQLDGGAPKLVVDISEEKSRLAGIDLGSVARQLEANLEGSTGGSLIGSQRGTAGTCPCRRP